jgi:hypothetical protein
MFKDEQRYDVQCEIRQRDIRAFDSILVPAVFAETIKRTGVRLTKSPLCLVNLVWLGIGSALHATHCFASVLTMTLKLLEDQQDFGQSKIGKAKKIGNRKKGKRKKHDPRRDDPTEVSEEAFSKARHRMPISFWINLIIILGENFQHEHGALHRFRGFRILTMDGTRIDLPNYEPLRKYFGTAKNKSGTHNCQARMVMMQFPFTRLPYRYELSPLSDGEVTLALRLTAHLQSGDLVLLDAGYWSYHLLCAIAKRRAFFAIRLRKNLNLKTTKLLVPNGKDRLVRWTPKDSRGNWRKLNLPKSIDLRLVTYCVPGFRQQGIVTNVLDPKKISRDDWTRLTTDCEDTQRILLPGLFHRRWEIETTYYELKVDQGMDRHLRSHTPESIEYEVAGHVVLYMLIRILMVKAAVKHGLDPLRLSYVEAKRELEQMRASLVTATTSWAVEVLIPRLLDRIASHVVPYRPGRHYPRRKNKATTTNGCKSKSRCATKQTRCKKQSASKVMKKG